MGANRRPVRRRSHHLPPSRPAQAHVHPAGCSWLYVALLEGKASVQNSWALACTLRADSMPRPGDGPLEGQQPGLPPGALTYSACLSLPVLGEVLAELLLQIHEDVLVAYKERQGLGRARTSVCARVHHCECVST